MLKVDNLEVSYGNVKALKDISISIEQGEFVSIIGANGAGKSTLLNTISGVLKTKSGSITYMGKSINKVPSHKIVRSGIVLVPEGREVFPKLTIKENLELGYAGGSKKESFDARYKSVIEMFPILEERSKQLAGTLSGGQQQMLAIGRGLMSTPDLLMLDEPSLGLAPIIVDELAKAIKQLNKDGLTILLVEQNASLALELSNRAYVFETGYVVQEGLGKDLLHDDKVKAAYLGI